MILERPVMTQFQVMLLSILGIVLATFSTSYTANPTAPWMAHVASIAGAVGAYLVGKLQLSPRQGTGVTGRAARLPLILLALIPLLGGCALAGPGIYSGMDPKQIHEAVKDKNAAVACHKGTYAGATVTSVLVNADRGVPGTSVVVDENCKTTLTTEGKTAPPR